MMKKSLVSALLVLMFIVILTMGFVACSGVTISTKHTIIFNVKMGSEWQVYASIRTFGNEIVQFPKDPTQSDGVFAGWYTNKLCTEEAHEYSFKNIALEADVELFAKFVNAPSTPYAITFETNGGTAIATQEITHGDKLKKNLLTTTKKGNTLVGWYKDAELTKEWNVDYDRVWSSATLYAKWEATGYRIEYVLDGGTNNKDNPAVYNFTDGLTLKDPTKLGYEFKGWFLDSEFSIPFNFETLYEDDLTLYAKWQIETYNITYELDTGESLVGEMPGTYTVEYDLTTLPTATKTGYNFDGWYVDESHGIILDPSKKYTGDLHLTPVFSEIKYMITYDLDGGTNNISNPPYVTYFHREVDLSDPSKLGYAFSRWYTKPGDVTFTSGTPISEDITLYAEWNLVHYSITYHLGTGESCDTSFNDYTVETDLAANLPTPTKTDYYFSAWYLDSGLTNRFNPETVYAENLNLYPAFVSSALVSNSVAVSSARAIAIKESDFSGKNVCIPITNGKDVLGVTFEGTTLNASQFYFDDSTKNLYIANGAFGSMTEGYRYLFDIHYEDSTKDRYSIGLADSSKYYITSVDPYSKSTSTELNVTFNSMTYGHIDRIEIDGVKVASYSVESNVLKIPSAIVDTFTTGKHLLEVMTDKGIISQDFAIANTAAFYPYNVKVDIETYPYTYVTWDYDFNDATFAVQIGSTTYTQVAYPDKFNGHCFDASGLLKVANQTFKVIATKDAEDYPTSNYTFKYDLYDSLSATEMKELVPTYLENSYTIYGETANMFITSFEELYNLMFYSALRYDSIVETFNTTTYSDYKALYVCFDFDIDEAYQLTPAGDYYYHRDSEGNKTTHLTADEYKLSNSTFVLCMLQDTMSLLSESTSYSIVMQQMTATGIIPGQTYKIGIKFSSVMAPNVDRTRANTSTTENGDITKQDYYVMFYHASSGITRADYKFPIELQNRGNADVYTSRELYLALEHGYNPVPKTASLSTLYTNIKNVLKGILDEDMSDYEIATAVYQWLGATVYYDHDAAKKAATLSGDAYNAVYGWSSYYMEGVFNNHLAVCNGIAAAYSTMLNMMGIPCHKIIGTGSGGAHTWNEVQIGGYWYISDPTWGSVTIGTEEILSMANFLTTYDESKENGHIDKPSVYGVNYADDVDFEPANLMKFTYNYNTYCLNNPDSATIRKALEYVEANGTPSSGKVVAITVYTSETTAPSMALYGYTASIVGDSSSRWKTFLYTRM